MDRERYPEWLATRAGDHTHDADDEVANADHDHHEHADLVDVEEDEAREDPDERRDLGVQRFLPWPATYASSIFEEVGNQPGYEPEEQRANPYEHGDVARILRRGVDTRGSCLSDAVHHGDETENGQHESHPQPEAGEGDEKHR